MKLKCIATGSSGNCYLLTADSGETLILDCGIPLMKIKEGLNWNIEDVAGCVVTHAHSDHSRALNDLKDMRIPVFAPYISLKPMALGSGQFKIAAFDLTTTDGRWTHTNADSTECPCYGFMIIHPEMGKMLYITDTELIKWRFKDVNHILLGVNYDKDLVDADNPKTRHVFQGHMSIYTACDFVKANYSDSLQNVIMCHLSSENADKDLFIEKMKKVAYKANVDVAEPGKEWTLINPNECPFWEVKMEPRIERLISFIKSKFEDGIQMFNTPSMAGDFRVPIYSEDEIAVLWAPYYEYIEIYGISDVEFATVMK